MLSRAPLLSACVFFVCLLALVVSHLSLVAEGAKRLRTKDADGRSITVYVANDEWTERDVQANLPKANRGRWRCPPRYRSCSSPPPFSKSEDASTSTCSKKTTQHGGVCEAKCKAGFSNNANSRASYECLNGKWVGLANKCRPQRCMQPPPFDPSTQESGSGCERAFAAGLGLPEGACCQVTCKDGFVSSGGGEPTISFNCANGLMGGSETCVSSAKLCTSPPSFDVNQATSGGSCAQVSASNPLQPGGTCTVDCLPGYAASDLSGVVSYTCGNDGTFAPDPSAQCRCRGLLSDIKHFDTGVAGIAALDDSDVATPLAASSDECCALCWATNCAAWMYMGTNFCFTVPTSGSNFPSDPTTSQCPAGKPLADVSLVIYEGIESSGGAGPCIDVLTV